MGISKDLYICINGRYICQKGIRKNIVKRQPKTKIQFMINDFFRKDVREYNRYMYTK